MFYLLLDKVENNNGLPISIDAASLTMLSLWRLLPGHTEVGGKATFSTLTIKKGYGENHCDSVQIYLPIKALFSITSDYIDKKDQDTFRCSIFLKISYIHLVFFFVFSQIEA